MKGERSYRCREFHGGRDQDLARRDLKAVNRTRNSSHGVDGYVEKEKFLKNSDERERNVFLRRDTAKWCWRT